MPFNMISVWFTGNLRDGTMEDELMLPIMIITKKSMYKSKKTKIDKSEQSVLNSLDIEYLS